MLMMSGPGVDFKKGVTYTAERLETMTVVTFNTKWKEYIVEVTWLARNQIWYLIGRSEEDDLWTPA